MAQTNPAGRRAVVMLLVVAATLADCRSVPLPSPSGAVTPPSSEGSDSPQPNGDAIVSSPAVSASLPDGLDRIGWTWTDRQLDAQGNAATVTIVAGLLGSTESFRLEGEGQVAVDGDILAVGRGEADGSTIQTYRIPTGELLGKIAVAGRVANLDLNAASGFVYYSRFRPGIGQEVHRSAPDGSRDVVLVELGPNHARDEMPNGTDMFDFGVAADGTFVAEACDKDGCALHIAAPADATATVVPMAAATPALCGAIGVSPPFLVVSDSGVCFADSSEAPLPFRVVDSRDGTSRLINAGPNFDASGLVVTDAGPQIVVRQRLANGGRSLSLVDVLSGSRQLIIPSLPTFPGKDDEIGSFAAARIGLPAGWLLLTPQLFGEPVELPNARVINVVDGRTLEIPSWPSQ